MVASSLSPAGGGRETHICRVRAREVQPGDFLPPQAVLHATAWQKTGFAVGPSRGDVLVDMPVLSGRVLLFGPGGVLDSIRADATVLVQRADVAPD